MTLVLALLCSFSVGTAHAASLDIKFPGFRTMDFADPVKRRLDDLTRVNGDFQGAAEFLHRELTVRVDTQQQSCGYLLSTNAVFRTTRQLLHLLSYLEPRGELPMPIIKHFGKLIGIVIHQSNKEYQARVTQIISEWIDELAAGDDTVDFRVHFGNAQRMVKLFDFAMELRAANLYTWEFKDFHAPR